MDFVQYGSEYHVLNSENVCRNSVRKLSPSSFVLNSGLQSTSGLQPTEGFSLTNLMSKKYTSYNTVLQCCGPQASYWKGNGPYCKRRLKTTTSSKLNTVKLKVSNWASSVHCINLGWWVLVSLNYCKKGFKITWLCEGNSSS